MQWYQLSKADVLSELDVDDKYGLDSEEVLKRQEKYGKNEIVFKKTPSWVRFLRQFKDPMVIILLITAAITGVLTILGNHMLPDTIVIISVVMLNAVLGFVQESKAQGALDALRSMMVPECMVMRDGNIKRIPSSNLVPGDIVVLEGGDKVPADIRFIELSNAHVDESSLTGESIPVEKTVAIIEGGNAVAGDQRNMGFSGTYLTRGTA
ncbi:MAG: HAD-IC family P-type ATPase, partial [Campylobacterales bacterium]|nr:HAD-IC family P-type ATPase [Campylobacterales bacterium]